MITSEDVVKTWASLLPASPAEVSDLFEAVGIDFDSVHYGCSHNLPGEEAQAFEAGLLIGCILTTKRLEGGKDERPDS